MTNSKTTKATDKANNEAKKAEMEQMKTELKGYEVVIRKGQASFLATAEAVLAICQKKLWKVSHKTMAAYFGERFDMSGPDVTRYCDAAEVIELLKSKGFTSFPLNEGQARALVNIKGLDEKAAVWAKVLESGKKITANLINSIANPTETGTSTAVEKPSKAALKGEELLDAMIKEVEMMGPQLAQTCPDKLRLLASKIEAALGTFVAEAA